MEPALPPRDPDDFYADDAPDWDDEALDGDEFDPEKPKRGRTAPLLPQPAKRRKWPFFLLGCCLLPFVCCCVALCGIAAVAGVVSESGVSRTDTQVEPLTADEPVRVTIDNRIGSVRLQPGANDEIKVESRITAYGFTKADARSTLDQIEVSVDVDANNNVTINVNTDRISDNFPFFANEVQLTIDVPRELASLDVDSNVGSIEVNNIEADTLRLVTNVGEVRFNGSIPTDSPGPFYMESNTGLVQVRLPRDAYVRISAESDVGDVSVSDSFADRSVDSEGRDAVGDSWVGTLGTGEDEPPFLELISDVGEVRVELR